MQSSPDEPSDEAMRAGMEGLIAAMRAQRPAPVTRDELGTTPSRPDALEGDDPALAQGTRIGRHVVLDRLGAGGMGEVYAAYDPKLDRKLALKVLRPGTADPRAHERLLREAQALAKLSHPNVVAIHDVGTTGDQVWLAMELVQGQTLRAWLETPRRWPEVVKVLGSAGEGLAAAHAVGLLHRDFKPDNVMLGDDGRVRVMDFGLARARLGAPTTGAVESEASPEAETPARPLTKAGTIVGTPAYMAPEQFDGGDLAATTDQFAFCVTLWEALYGERPFRGRTPLELIANVLGGRRRAPTTRAVPSWLRRACERGLAMAPTQRWRSMAALLEALARGRTRARVRKGLVAVAVLAALAAGAEGIQRWDVARQTTACEASGDEIASAWNDERRIALHEALVATGASYAETTAIKVMPWLDRQAEEWREARVGACLDADVRERWDAVTLERALWCLDERHMQLESLVDELTLADADVVQKAVTAAASLTPVAPCRNEAVLQALGLPPEDAREAVRAVRADVTRADSLEQAGRYAQGLELARRALTRAEALQWAPLTAAARQELGQALERTGSYAQAEAVLEDAYFEASGGVAPEVLVGAATELVYVVGERLSRHGDGLRWKRHADAALAGVRDEGQLRRARLLGYVGLVHDAAGAHDQAEELLTQAVAIKQAALGPEHPNVAGTLGNLALVRASVGAYEDALALDAQVLQILENALGPEHPDVAKILNNMANVHSHTGAHEKAKVLHERVLAVTENALGADHPHVAKSLVNLANSHVDMGAYEEAKAVYERAIAIYEKRVGRDHPGMATALNNLASAHMALNEHEEAAALLEAALAIRERALGPEHSQVAECLDNLAMVLVETGAPDRAVALHERALMIGEKELGPDHPRVANTLDNLAIALHASGALDEARIHHERALAIWERALGRDNPDVAYPLLGLAELALAQQRSSEAVSLAARAVTVREQGVPAELLASARFVLAQALWNARADQGRDRPRALTLATQARDAFREAGPSSAKNLAKAQAWLDAHGGR